MNDYLLLTVAMLGIGVVLTIIPALLSLFEKKFGSVARVIHIAVNIIFIIFALYNLNFVPLYPHGPSPAWLLPPAWLAFTIFYGFIYSKMLRDKASMIIKRIIFGIYLLGTIFGCITIILDWNIK